ncbi:MAG: LTA synthase family protein [Bacteroidetes bacterium]|nr:LTA synthase family protein [Bacteroidota bacterium]
MKSYTEKVNLMDNEKAISQTRQLLHIDHPDTLISPIARTIIPQDSVHKYNIVLVLMESMSAHYMAYFGNKEQITPNLDALTQEAVFFTNAYSAGIHTNNGIFSTLYSFPALKRIRPMHTMPIRKYTGLPYVTKQYGYQNLFFSAHSFEFDNIVNFIPANHFDRLYSSELFPPEAALSAFGVPDQYLYDYTLQTLDTISKATPFFATILTASNHEPYVLPNDFKTPLQEKNKRPQPMPTGVLATFKKGSTIKLVSQHPFVFVADHGFRVGYNAYDLPLSYQHIPHFLLRATYFKTDHQQSFYRTN